ncbi:hypothetical protein [Glutamicibacter arilaitensis]|uniref:hypothetical protein n=1 Tax=Glutamicibacter arilaitensis TaxID=256701 RepID=UPI00384A8C2E
MRPLRVMRRVAFPLIFAGALAGALASCSAADQPDSACMPPEFSLSQGTAQRGEAVEISAPDADCDPRYGPKAQVEISIADALGAEIIHTTEPMGDAGKFSYTFEVPQDMELGKAAISAFPHAVDWCDDTGVNNRIYGGLAIVRASCAIPVKTLEIIR